MTNLGNISQICAYQLSNLHFPRIIGILASFPFYKTNKVASGLITFLAQLNSVIRLPEMFPSVPLRRAQNAS